MNHPSDTRPSDPSPAPAAGPALPPDRPHGLDPRALLEAVAAPTGGPESQPHPPPDADQLAASFPQLEIGECLGRGGMGVVYRARQRSLDRTVALKLLAPERGHDPAFAARFAREAQALAKLSHPNIVTIHDFGQAGGFYYLLMEFVDGVNLRQAMQAGRFTPEQALAIVPPVCDALHYAHSHGLVHRDIKPENLLLDKDGRIKIADFGIAKMLDADDPDTGLAESQPAGTPRYMAPEQQDTSRRTDHRADIYSLGVVLYELLTGEVPGSRLEPPSRRVQIDVRLDEIVLRALEAEPERRYQTAVELRTRIEDLGAAGRAAVAAASTAQPQPFPTNRTSAALDPTTGRNVLRAGRATVTTPERLATASGQFFHFRNNSHQLVLDASSLTLSGGAEATVIPLAAIRDLSLGRFPRTVNPAGLDFILITYADGSGERRLIVAPLEGLLGSPTGFNVHVHAWWSAIRDAAVAATGRAPTLTPPSQLGLPGSSPWLTAALLVPLVAGLGLGIWLLDSPHAPRVGRVRPDSGPGLATVILLTLAAITPILGTGRSENGRSSWLGTAIGLGALVLAAVTLLGQPGFVEVLILGAAASFSIHWLKKRGERVHWAEEPAASVGRTARRLVFTAALGLTVLFAAPHYSVLGAGNIMVWEVGLPTPWITDRLHVFPGGGQQRVRDMHLDRPSFYVGFAALASWMLWLRLQAWRHGAALFEVIAPATDAGDRARVRWGTLATVWTAMASLSVIALLLVCVFMRAILGDFPAPAPLLVLAVFPVSLVVLNGLRLGLRQARAAAGSAGPAPRSSCAHGCLWLAAFLAVGFLILAAVWTITYSENRLHPPSPLPVTIDPGTPSAPHPAATPAPQ